MDSPTLKRSRITTRFLATALGAALCVGSIGCGWMQTAMRMRDGLGRSLADRGMDAKEYGDDAEAVRLLSQAAERDPDQVDVHRELAGLHENLGDSESQLRHLIRVAELEPELPESWAQLSKALAEHGYPERARATADKALALDPTNTTSVLTKARLDEDAGDAFGALEGYHRVLEDNPGDVEARLAVARIHLKQGNADRAAPVLRSLCACPLADESDKCEASWCLGIAYGRIGRWTDAVRALETGTTSHDTADDWYRLAFASHEAGDLSTAREALREVQRRQPSHDGGRKLANVLTRVETGLHPVGYEVEVPVPTGWEASRLQ